MNVDSLALKLTCGPACLNERERQSHDTPGRPVQPEVRLECSPFGLLTVGT
jgi:hypothetical protein